jgi:hypothetical protein
MGVRDKSAGSMQRDIVEEEGKRNQAGDLHRSDHVLNGKRVILWEDEAGFPVDVRVAGD